MKKKNYLPGYHIILAISDNNFHQKSHAHIYHYIHSSIFFLIFLSKFDLNGPDVCTETDGNTQPISISAGQKQILSNPNYGLSMKVKTILTSSC